MEISIQNVLYSCQKTFGGLLLLLLAENTISNKIFLHDQYVLNSTYFYKPIHFHFMQALYSLGTPASLSCFLILPKFSVPLGFFTGCSLFLECSSCTYLHNIANSYPVMSAQLFLWVTTLSKVDLPLLYHLFRTIFCILHFIIIFCLPVDSHSLTLSFSHY